MWAWLCVVLVSIPAALLKQLGVTINDTANCVDDITGSSISRMCCYPHWVKNCRYFSSIEWERGWEWVRGEWVSEGRVSDKLLPQILSVTCSHFKLFFSTKSQNIFSILSNAINCKECGEWCVCVCVVSVLCLVRGVRVVNGV